MKQSSIRAVSKIIRDVDGVNLGQGICDLPIPQAIRDSTRHAIDHDPAIYTSDAGIPDLRDAIAAKLRSYNAISEAFESNVMVSGGSTGAYVCALFTLLDPGDEVVLFEPYYGYHKRLLDLVGAKTRFVELTSPEWTWKVEELESQISEHTKLIVVNTPGNPCGKVWTTEELSRILAIAQHHDILVLTDEIYEYMLYDGHEHVSMASLPGAFDRTITISGFSKSYNMTGWRLGYACGPEELIQKMTLLNDLIYVCAPAPLQYGVRAAFELPDTYYTEMRSDYAARRRLLVDTLERCGFDVPMPQGAYYILADFSRLSGKISGMGNADEAMIKLVEEAQVATVPGSAFYSGSQGDNMLRFCFAKELNELQRAADSLLRAFGK